MEQFRERLAGQPNLDVEVIDNVSVSELCTVASHLSRDVIVLPVGYHCDPQGNSYVPRDVMTQLANASTAPVYAVSDTFIGAGPVGGYVVSWEKTGQLAAETAVQ